MKSRKFLYLEKMLRYTSVKILNKYNPQIVAITGSVGKTTTKEAVWSALAPYFEVRRNEKNYNNEVGVPLTIIGAQSGENSYLRWLGVLVKGWSLILRKKSYPEVLVLELGADRPGDMKYLLQFIKPSVAILTSVGVSHLEFFKNKKELFKEKAQLLKGVPSGGLVALNFDLEEIRELPEQLTANVITFGFKDGADMLASDINFGYKLARLDDNKTVNLLQGVSFKLNYKGKIIPLRLHHCIGRPQIYAVLAAMAAARFFDLNLLEVGHHLSEFVPYPGRMSLLGGIKHTAIIDDSYNSAPDSVKAALETLSVIEAERKVAVLGDMLELGEVSEEMHRQIGTLVAQSGVHLFITVGDRMTAAARQYERETGSSDTVVEFDNPMEAGRFLQEMMQQGDVILVKGSQGMRMEKIVEEVMAEPEKKDKLLVRQDAYWLEKEYEKP